MMTARTGQSTFLLFLLLFFTDTAANSTDEQGPLGTKDCSKNCFTICNSTLSLRDCLCFCVDHVKSNPRTKREAVKQDEASEREVRRPKNDAVIVFRLLGLSSTTLCAGLTAMLYLFNRMWSADCAAQIGEALSLTAAHSCTFLITTDATFLSLRQCWIVSLLLQFFFLSVFFFYVIEAVIIGRHLLKVLPELLFRSGWSVFLFCWGVAAAFTVLTAYTVYKEEEAFQNNCWLKFSTPWTWMTLGPVLVSLVLQTSALIPAFCVTEVPFKFGLEDALRAEVMLTSRWACAITALLTYAAWFTAVTAANARNPYWYVAAAVTDILLGVVIITLRISTDFQLQARLMTALKSTRPRSNRIDSWDVTPSSKASTASTKAISPAWTARYSGKPILRY